MIGRTGYLTTMGEVNLGSEFQSENLKGLECLRFGSGWKDEIKVYLTGYTFVNSANISLHIRAV
jgi:hypothetical protein